MDNEITENFEELLNQSFSKLDNNYEPGDQVTGLIVNEDDELVFVDIGYKHEAIALRSEFSEDDLSIYTKKAANFIISQTRGTEIELTKKIGAGFVSDDLILYAIENQIPVYGRIVSSSDAGYDILIGELKAFCPGSQLGKSELSLYQANKNSLLPFAVIEKKRGNYLVSSRVLHEKEQKIVIEKLSKELKPGQSDTGTVTRTEEYGVFVKLDCGLEGLVPRRELDHSRFITPESFNVGDTVKAVITSLDWTTNKHTLSIKASIEDPWTTHASLIREGENLTARVCGFIKDGVFAEIYPGVDGFIHKSLLSKQKRINDPKDIFTIGQQIEVSVISVDIAKKRISLDYMSGESDPWDSIEYTSNNRDTATIESSMPAGLVIRLSNGLEAFVPKGELLGRSEEPRYIVGSKIDIVLIETDKNRRRAVASEKQLGEVEQKEQLKDFIDGQKQAEHGSSLGALLGDKFKELQKKVDANDKT